MAEEDSLRSEKSCLADTLLDISAIKINISKFEDNEKTVKTHPHKLPIVFFSASPRTQHHYYYFTL
jgi:hypothetical protein